MSARATRADAPRACSARRSPRSRRSPAAAATARRATTAAGSAPRTSAATRCATACRRRKSGALPEVGADAPRRRARRRRRHRRPRRGARAARAPASTTCHVLELEDRAGGNSRGHAMAGMRCPLGAHYLPVPGERRDRSDRAARRARPAPHRARPARSTTSACSATARRSGSSSTAAGAKACCRRSRRCRPPSARRRSAQYRAFSAAVAAAGDGGAFAIPTARSRWSAGARGARRASRSRTGSTRRACTAPALRWYLDYCCRDDYGAGSAQVSAWAGLHYFASRHGFRAPGDELQPSDGGDGVLTWPEGNAWLAERLAAPLGERLHAGPGRARASTKAATRSRSTSGTPRAARRERWIAPRVVLATPLFVAARLLAAPPPALRRGGARRCATRPGWSPTCSSTTALDDRPGAPPSWDNVIYGGLGLGYVDAMHQSTRPFAGPTVLTAYCALGGDSAARARRAARGACSATTGAPGRRAIVADLALAHPDLPAKVTRVDLMRYGHAMSIPVPGVRSSAALRRACRAAATGAVRARRPVRLFGVRGGVLSRQARRPGRRAPKRG